jgi:hypothetical protein
MGENLAPASRETQAVQGFSCPNPTQLERLPWSEGGKAAWKMGEELEQEVAVN